MEEEELYIFGPHVARPVAQIATDGAEVAAMGGNVGRMRAPEPLHEGGGPAPRRAFNHDQQRSAFQPYARPGEGARVDPQEGNARRGPGCVPAEIGAPIVGPTRRVATLADVDEIQDNIKNSRGRPSQTIEEMRTSNYLMQMAENDEVHDLIIEVPVIRSGRSFRLQNGPLSRLIGADLSVWDRYVFYGTEDDGTHWRPQTSGSHISKDLLMPPYTRDGPFKIMLGRRRILRGPGRRPME